MSNRSVVSPPHSLLLAITKCEWLGSSLVVASGRFRSSPGYVTLSAGATPTRGTIASLAAAALPSTAMTPEAVPPSSTVAPVSPAALIAPRSSSRSSRGSTAGSIVAAPPMTSSTGRGSVNPSAWSSVAAVRRGPANTACARRSSPNSIGMTLASVIGSPERTGQPGSWTVSRRHLDQLVARISDRDVVILEVLTQPNLDEVEDLAQVRAHVATGRLIVLAFPRRQFAPARMKLRPSLEFIVHALLQSLDQAMLIGGQTFEIGCGDHGDRLGYPAPLERDGRAGVTGLKARWLLMRDVGLIAHLSVNLVDHLHGATDVRHGSAAGHRVRDRDEGLLCLRPGHLIERLLGADRRLELLERRLLPCARRHGNPDDRKAAILGALQDAGQLSPGDEVRCKKRRGHEEHGDVRPRHFRVERFPPIGACFYGAVIEQVDLFVPRIRLQRHHESLSPPIVLVAVADEDPLVHPQPPRQTATRYAGAAPSCAKKARPRTSRLPASCGRWL